MFYDLDNPQHGGDCPRCKFPMESLRAHNALRRDGGYLLDTGIGWDPDDHIVSSLLLGSFQRFFWRNVGEPLLFRYAIHIQQRWHARILRRFPASLICTHCGYIRKHG